MNILIIGSTDSYNQSLLGIAREFKKNNHKVSLLYTHKEEVHNQSIFCKDIESKYWFEFDDYNSYDVAVYGNILNREVLFKVLKTKILKISIFFHLVVDDFVLGGAHLNADMTLCYGQRFISNQIKNGIVHNFMATGVPYDQSITPHNEKNKIFLFLEQHFYPSGEKGKKELAKFLIDLAKEKSDYKIIVKPRSLENEEGSKHKAKHIYSYIDKRPENLVLLREHLDLEELISKSEIVATTFSTAISPAILKNKRILFIYGFSLIETKYYTKSMINRYYKLYKETKQLVHFKDIKDIFNRANPVNTKYKNDLFFPRKKEFNHSIFNAIEYIYHNRINGIFTIDNYKKKSNNIKPPTKKEQIVNRLLERFYLINIVTGFRLSKERLLLLRDLDMLQKSNLDINSFQKLSKEIKDKYVEEGINRVLVEYKRFPVGFKEYYIRILYEKNCLKEFKSLPINWHIADYYYYQYLFLEESNPKEAKNSLVKYLNKTMSSSYSLTSLYDNKKIIEMKKVLENKYNGIY